MRVTNSMIYGNGLNNIWRNVRHVNQLVQQIETRKLIQRPSDDPIRAARSLRYRTTLEETQQFLANANSAMSWMETTESAFMNLLTGESSVLQQMYTRFVAGADGVHSLDDRLAMVTELREFFDQIALEMNQTYMGRYVFSGFFTQHPPVLNVDWPGRNFVITQTVDSSQIQQVRSFQNFVENPGQQPQVHNINVIKLPYRDIDFHLNLPGIPESGIFLADGTPIRVIDFHSTHPDAYRPPESMSIGALNGLDPSDPNYDPTETIHFVHHVRDTGELILSDAMRNAFGNGVQMTYEIRDLRAGELNPIVYFPSFELLGLDREGMTVGAGGSTYNSTSPINSSQMFNHLQNAANGSGAPIQSFQFLMPDGTTFSLANATSFAIDTELANYFNANAAGEGWPWASFSEFVQNMYGPTPTADNYAISPANLAIFQRVMEGALQAGFNQPNVVSALPPGVNAVNPGVTITPAGIIEINFAVSPAGSAVFAQMGSCQGGGGQNFGCGLFHTSGAFQVVTDMTPPLVNIPTLDNAHFFDASNHYIVKEVSPANHIPINSLAPRAFTAAMYSDLRGLFEFVESIRPTERRVIEQYFMDQDYEGQALDNAVDTFLSYEEGLIKDALHTRFTLMLRQFQMHTDEVQREHTHLGSRMTRVEMLEVRLEEEELNMTALLSINEDTPLQEAIMRKNMAEAAFQAALRANAMIVQLSLVNFLR